MDKLTVSIFILTLIDLSSSQRSSNFGITVVNSDQSGKTTENTLNDIFSTFQSINDGNLAAAVASLENNIRVFEHVLLKQQNVITNMVTNIQDKIDEVQFYDTNGLFKKVFEDIDMFLYGVSKIEDFVGGSKWDKTETKPLPKRIATIKGKYSEYVQKQTMAAKNSSAIGALTATMNAIFVRNFESLGEDLMIEYSALNGTMFTMRNELVQYATALGTATMKLITLQTDTNLLNEGCTFSLPCGEFLIGV
jgi:hypothetical protein